MATIELTHSSAAQSLPPTAVRTGQAAPQPQLETPASRTFFMAGGHGATADTLSDAAIEAQMRKVWLDLFAVMKAAGFEKANIRSAVMYVTMGGKCRLFRRVRDQMLERLPVPSSCIQVETLEQGSGCIAIEAQVAR